jgi:hypothetical protein
MSAFHSSEGVQREIELQHTDLFLAEDAEQPVLGCLGGERAHALDRYVPRDGNQRNLKLGGDWREAGSKPLAEVVTGPTGISAGLSCLSATIFDWMCSIRLPFA